MNCFLRKRELVCVAIHFLDFVHRLPFGNIKRKLSFAFLGVHLLQGLPPLHPDKKLSFLTSYRGATQRIVPQRKDRKVWMQRHVAKDRKAKHPRGKTKQDASSSRSVEHTAGNVLAVRDQGARKRNEEMRSSFFVLAADLAF